MTLSKIGFNSSIFGAGVNHGYGYASVELINAWNKLEIPVWAWDQEAPVYFNFSQPQYYDVFPDKDIINIGYTPWESTKIPDHWLYYMQQMTEVWTTSEACKQWYKDCGVTKNIRVLHHGLNRSHWPSRKREVTSKLRILAMGAEAPRKGTQMTVEAFRAAFPEPHRAGIELVIKGKPCWSYEPKDGEILVEEFLDQSKLTELYLSCHAMFYPTNGEGFGFIPFNAMATGMPTWATNWGGTADFVKFGWPINPEKIEECSYPPHEGFWAKIDFDNLVDLMRDFYRSPNYFFGSAYRKSTLMDQDFSWDAIAEKSVDWFLSLLP